MAPQIIDLLIEQRNDFINKKGFAPDVILVNDLYFQFTGKKILGMTLRTSPYVGIKTVVMYREIALLLEIKF